MSRSLRNPTTFDIQFRAAAGATINLSTFQAKYGWLGINSPCGTVALLLRRRDMSIEASNQTAYSMAETGVASYGLDGLTVSTVLVMMAFLHGLGIGSSASRHH